MAQPPPLLQVDDLLCKEHGKGELYHLRRLDGKDGEGDPASIAAHCVAYAGNSQKGNKGGAGPKEPGPSGHDHLQIQLGQEKEEENADDHGCGLLHRIGVKGGVIPGGGVDQCNTEQIDGDAQPQQQMIRLGKGVPDQIPDGRHRQPSSHQKFISL